MSTNETLRKTIYFVFGGPGAGKGTICTQLSKELGLAHICVGELLRAAVANDTLEPVSKAQVQSAMQGGRLAPIEVILTVLEKEMREAWSTVILMDGFPRSMEQMVAFERSFGEIECGLLFTCSQETMERRIVKRSMTSNRIDDNMETVRLRLKQFEEETMPCVDLLREKNRLVEIDCNGDLDEIYQPIKARIEELIVKKSCSGN